MVEGGLEAEVRQSFENLKSVLANNGADVTKLVKTTVFITEMDNFAPMNELYEELIGQPFPARSTVAVKALPRGAIFEIEAVANV
jgi:2-iminobutanoate/2-iminopropanoate deaminase